MTGIRVLETVGRNPRRVETILSDQEALDAIASRTDSFAKNLVQAARQGALTQNRLVWLHILALEQFGVATQPTTQLDSAGLKRVVDLFVTAKLHLKKPKIRLQTPSGLSIAISPASPRGRNAGYLYVTGKDDAYYGKISPSGEFEEKSVTDELRQLLLEFASNPAETAIKYGRLTGKCCFCALPLKDERSTKAGYGETCSKNWGLPWGKEKTDLGRSLGAPKSTRPRKSARTVPGKCQDEATLRAQVNAGFAAIDAQLEQLYIQLNV